MNRLFSNTYRLYYSLLLTFAGLILFMGYLNVQDAESFMIIALTFVVLGCGVLFGILPALIFTLLILFFIGSVMFFTELGHENPLFSNQTLQDVVIWGVALLFFAISAGSLHERIKTLRHTIEQQKQAIKQFVAIDSTTGFDNAERMKLELSEEMKRAERYKQPFVFILLHMNYAAEFKSLYGEKEMQHLFQQLSLKIRESIRETDKKFRLSEERMGLLLTHTPEENVSVVLDKLKDKLQTHVLLNGREVTLTFHVCHLTSSSEYRTPEQFLEELEKEMMMNEL
ncbi:GGDEF domain-containing protein [Bacillus pumilus]|uniref:GGDEF domain-containing protein n=1 Tax=Bacillus pumilus TaxID=1408 RepID=UPI000F874288|nr:GGDEF domain-containing protein [Bacillus pumilus]RST66660.1 GGDEF domain-containing protein [Bacillus pumilus]